MQERPKVTQDGTGGAYIIWQDNREPYHPYWALFMQRIYASGEPAWNPDGVFISERVSFHQILPDGEGGFILHTNPGGSAHNTAIRFDADGSEQWQREYVSWSQWAQMVPGDEGFFYFGFIFDYEVYGQKIDVNGRPYWPIWGSGQPGALIARGDDWPHGLHMDFCYHDNYFFGIFDRLHPFNFYPQLFFVQSLDSEGYRRWGNEYGLLIAVNDTLNLKYANIIHDGGNGAVSVWVHGWSYEFFNDIYAKHINSDGTLGGPDPRKKQQELIPQISGVSEGIVGFSLPKAGKINLVLFNLIGRKVKTIGEGYFNSGVYTIKFDRHGLTSGICFLRLKTIYGQHVVKVVHVR
jgi:hypothetical protein